MKDGTEVEHLYNEIWPEVKKRLIAETTQYQLSDCLKPAFNYIDKNIICHKVDMPYCACFSDNGDLSSQWRRYADYGTGVSIGFDTDYFKIKPQPPQPNTNIRDAIGLGTVCYDHDCQVEGLYNITKQLLLQEKQGAVQCQNVLANLTHYSAIFKKQCFSDEQEKRIIYYFYDQHQFSDSFLLGPCKYEYKDPGYCYFKFSWFNSDRIHAITNIYLGPKCKLSSSEMLKKLNRFNVQIKKNRISKSRSSYK